jgi:hypothetical protein
MKALSMIAQSLMNRQIFNSMSHAPRWKKNHHSLLRSIRRNYSIANSTVITPEFTCFKTDFKKVLCYCAKETELLAEGVGVNVSPSNRFSRFLSVRVFQRPTIFRMSIIVKSGFFLTCALIKSARDC